METVTIKRNDRAPSIAATLSDADGVIDLTSCTVKFFARLEQTDEIKINGTAAVIVSAAAGTVRYDFAALDVDTAGDYEIEWEITLPSGKKTTVPNNGYDRLVIGGDIG